MSCGNDCNNNCDKKCNYFVKILKIMLLIFAIFGTIFLVKKFFKNKEKKAESEITITQQINTGGQDVNATKKH